MIKHSFTLLLIACSLLLSCNINLSVDEKDKIFHAGPVNSGFGGIYWGLYKNNIYQFCDGDFMDHGCYAGLYSLSGDTIILHDLKKHQRIPTNKFIIRRCSEMDSSYWAWKYPNNQTDWKILRQNDSLSGSTGDVFPIDENNKIRYERDGYFLIRLDSLKNSR